VVSLEQWRSMRIDDKEKAIEGVTSLVLSADGLKHRRGGIDTR
jgi:hypothetical protein